MGPPVGAGPEVAALSHGVLKRRLWLREVDVHVVPTLAEHRRDS